MAIKLPNLVERAAAQLLKSGNLDGSVAQLLVQEPPTKAAEKSADRATAPSPTARPDPARPGVDPQATTHSPAPQATTHSPAPLAPVASRSADLPALAAGHSSAAGETIPPSEPAPAQAIVSTQGLVSTPGLVRPQARSIELSALERAGMIDWGQARSRISEEFRVAQRQVLRNAASPDVVEQGNANLIMLTSARPGEGKSFVSLNLAASIARQRDHDVLLVDIDYKQDSIGTALGLSGARGLLDLVTDPTLDPEQVIVQTGLKNLSFLPIGQHGERSPELFATRQATRLIQSLGRRYADRLVILDAPPCLATSEPGVLASIVGQIVLVVEAEKTQREEVEAAMDLIHTCPTITLLLNKVQVSSRYSFGA